MLRAMAQPEGLSKSPGVSMGKPSHLRGVAKCYASLVRGVWEVSMVDVYETPNPKRDEQIDTIGWVFVASAVIITLSAGVIAYYGNGEMVATAPVSHVTGSPG